jgi:ATP-dependent helicase/nuclease subunit B
MIESRRDSGTIEIFCSKTDAQGKFLVPSRLLLRATGEELAHRVAALFADVPPADSQLHWQADWEWQPRIAAVAPEKEGVRVLSITALRDYIACPYRFYLKHGLRMNQREGERGEWNHRDFGNVIHDILETWGNDHAARDLDSATALTDYWHELLAQWIEKRYGPRPNLALKIQSAALRQRLAWLADAQAQHRAEGWQVLHVEKDFRLSMPLITLSGKVDRIDYHPATDAYMMWDYKTGKVDDKVRNSHLKNVTAKTTLPPHLANDGRLLVPAEKGKSQQWINLQLPLYAAAGLTPKAPGVGYIAVGDARDKVFFKEWENFDAAITQCARDCAEMLTERIAANVFWPPNEKVKYHDYDILNAGSDLEKMTIAP